MTTNQPAERQRATMRTAVRTAALVLAAAAAFPALLPTVAAAGEADVVGAEAVRGSDGTWRFDVTVRHADEGWDHYADRWEVLAPDGTLLAVRELAHPHVTEQPFTRSLGGVEIPPEIDRVRLRARDSVHGYGGAELPLGLPGR